MYFGLIIDIVLIEMVGVLDNVLCYDGVLIDKGKYFYYIFFFMFGGVLDVMLCLVYFNIFV